MDAELREFWQTKVGSPRREIFLNLGTLPAAPKNAPSRLLLLIGRQIEVRVLGDELWLGEQLWVRSGQLGAEVCCVPEGAPTEAWALIFTELHRAGGWLPLHASVIAAGQRAVALTGVSGAGKSTAALRLYTAGRQVIAEDRAFWHAASGEIRGLDTHLRVYDDSLKQFAPDLLSSAGAWDRDAHGKLRMPIQIGAPHRTQLIQLLLLSVRREELSAPERVRALWETTGVPLTTTAREQVQRGIARLLPLLAPCSLSRKEVVSTAGELLSPIPMPEN
ncbi:hypothetical protein FNU79_18060 [Deinococcus detaillensis]|uniref:HPr kinase/phosphorylase C-terminal domain-containing protein n=1 Tax=Deinococcus detaillensis TaxID=2592048 RepID=A0A553UGQ4_9DEIO|nr:hypothetical protein [Deinococcus detaillensis]TSA79387.1 hypothetical protein FNU79_18060 [Deinococcus detaillensis]